jgi:energy-coupling factor transporter ATP-binding protein EcfA2
MPLLEVKNLHVEIDGKKILNGLDLTIEKGKVHASMGPNGSGKSTLAYVLAGKTDYQLTAGEVLFDGEDLHAAGRARRARRLPRLPVPDRNPRRSGALCEAGRRLRKAGRHSFETTRRRSPPSRSPAQAPGRSRRVYRSRSERPSSTWHSWCRSLRRSVAQPKEFGSTPAGAGDRKRDLREAPIGLAVPGKAFGQDRHPVRPGLSSAMR